MTATPEPNPPLGEPEKQSFGELVGMITGQVSTLVRGEIELAQVQLKSKFAKLGLGGALFAAAGVLALYMLGLLLLAAVWAFSLILPLWAAFLLVSGILLAVILVLVAVGAAAMKKSNEVTVEPGAGFKASAEAAKRGFKDE